MRRWSDRYRKRIVFIIIAVLLLLISGSIYLFRDTFTPPVQITETISTVDKEKYEQERRRKQEEMLAKLKDVIKQQPAVKGEEKKITTHTDEVSSKDPEKKKELVAGWVIITDPWGRQVNKFRAGLAGNGWLALPARACLGGNRWHFYTDSGQATEISGGQWISGDKVGLWHLAESAGSFDGPELTPWNESEPVSWSSLESADEYHSINLSPGRAEGFFVLSSLPDYINETGIFLQGGKIVGWSFGLWLPNGYLWQGKAGAELAYKTWVRYFYNITFANGREEKFARALAMQKGYAGLEQLAFFIEGFRLQPKLAPEDTPYYLMPEEILKQMHILVTNAVNSGDGNRVVDMLNSQVLKRIGDISLFMDVVPAIASARGFGAAIAEIEDTGLYITRQLGHEIPALNALHIKYYQVWLQSLVSAGAIDEGLQTYSSATAYYPDDPYIHLLGAELVLMDGDWREAERLLNMRNYPPDYQDRYHLLALRVAEMKGQEDKIVIRFPRGSGTIPVTASVNGTLRQDFLVDTGASMVTIPSSTAALLGLEIVHGQRPLSTAGGIVTAGEVIISAIEIDGWTEYDVGAYVLDLPGRPGLGLLGLNYLGRFRMDLKTEEGTLVLTPR
jgi:clan AA aspartic protease (TIGR02281 family)